MTTETTTNQSCPEAENADQGPAGADRLARALEELLPRLNAIPEDELRVLKAAVPVAVAAGLRCARSYAADRGSFEGTFKLEAFDPASYDDLADRCLALWHADALLRQLEEQPGEIAMAVARGRELRAKLLRGADYLWRDHAKLAEVLATMRTGHGRLDLADDLIRLASLFTEHWALATGRCDVAVEDLAQARRLAPLILGTTLPESDPDTSARRELRDRAAEYLRRGITDVRAAALFVFRDDPGALERYPSLFANRRSRSRNGKSTTEGPAVVPSPAVDELQTPVSAELQPTATQTLS